MLVHRMSKDRKNRSLSGQYRDVTNRDLTLNAVFQITDGDKVWLVTAPGGGAEGKVSPFQTF
jgi:hypothetical protein